MEEVVPMRCSSLKSFHYAVSGGETTTSMYYIISTAISPQLHSVTESTCAVLMGPQDVRG